MLWLVIRRIITTTQLMNWRFLDSILYQKKSPISKICMKLSPKNFNSSAKNAFVQTDLYAQRHPSHLLECSNCTEFLILDLVLPSDGFNYIWIMGWNFEYNSVKSNWVYFYSFCSISIYYNLLNSPEYVSLRFHWILEDSRKDQEIKQIRKISSLSSQCLLTPSLKA